MLQKFNDRIKGWLAWVIVLIIAITFTLFGVDYYIRAKHDHSIATRVNGLAISTQQVELSARRLKQSSADVMTLAEEKKFKDNVLHHMVMNLVSAQAATSSGFYIDPQQVNQAILSIPDFQEEGHFSSARYMYALNHAFFTPQTFEKEIQQSMLLKQQRFSWVDTSFVLPSEFNYFVDLEQQTRSYAYLVVPSSWFMLDQPISTTSIDTYYKKHVATFLTPERVRIEYVRFSKNSLRSSIHITEADLAPYLQDYKPSAHQSLADIKKQVRDQLISERLEQKYTDLIEQLADLSYQQPDSLEPVAQALHLTVEHSPFFTRNGGDTDVTKNSRVIHAAFSHDVLKFKNNSAPLVMGDESVLVLRVQSYEPAIHRPLVDVKPLIIEQLKKQQALLAAQEAAKKIIASHTSLLTFQGHALTWQIVNHADRHTETLSPEINQLAFDLPRVGTKEMRRLPQGDYVIVLLKHIEPGDIKQLDPSLKKSLYQAFEQQRKALDYELYLHSLMQDAKYK